MRDIPVLILLQNVVMFVFVLLIAYSGSFANQIILSTTAVTYWLLGYAMIRRRTKGKRAKA